MCVQVYGETDLGSQGYEKGIKKRPAGKWDVLIQNDLKNLQTPACEVLAFYKLVGFVKVGNLHILGIPQ